MEATKTEYWVIVSREGKPRCNFIRTSPEAAKEDYTYACGHLIYNEDVWREVQRQTGCKVMQCRILLEEGSDG